MAEVKEKEKPSRTPAQWIIPIVLVVLVIFAPPLINVVLPVGAVGWTIVGFLVVVSFGGSFLDAKVYRYNLTVFGLLCVAYFVSMKLYYNSGTWIYLIMVGLLSFNGVYFGDKEGAKASLEEDS